MATQTDSVTSNPTLSPKSYDADTPSVVNAEGKRSPLRIAGVGGTEIGAGSDAEYFRNGLYSIFGGAEAKVSTQGKGVFGRDIGNLEVEGVDWRHLLYEVGVSDRWTNYGYDEKDTEADERYKWYAGQSQATNIDAYKLLESDVAPNTIISDEDFNRIELLRKSLKTHMADAQEGVLDKEDALLVAKELMGNPELLTLAQKRRWYESARTSNVGKVMLANWNDPFTRSEIESQGRTVGIDVSPSVDTSYWGITKNAVKQWAGTTSKFSVGEHTGSHREGTFQSTYTEQDVLEYIEKDGVSPDVAVKMYDAFEEAGGQAAIDIGEYAKIDQETVRQGQAIEKKKGTEYVAKSLYAAAAPYITDPTTYMGGTAGAKIGAKVAFSKVSSPLMRKLLQRSTVGATTGLGESMAFTTNNYKDFSNEELLETWAMDAGFGAAFGAIFTLGEHGVRAYGKSAKAKAAGEGIEDINYVRPDDRPRTKADRIAMETKKIDEAVVTAQDTEATRNATLKVPELKAELKALYQELGIRGHSKFKTKKAMQEELVKRKGEQAKTSTEADIEANRVDSDEEIAEQYNNSLLEAKEKLDNQADEIIKEANEGVTPPTVDIDVPEPPAVPKPEPKQEPVPEGSVNKQANQTPTDSRTPEQIDADEAKWQAETMEKELEHQGTVVRPKIEEVNKSHNFIAKIHRALGKGLGLQEFASKMILSSDNKLSYVGTHILETGVGFTGKFKRKASAALIKDSIYTRNVGNLNKAYVDNIKGWSMAQGADKYKAFKAAWEGGKVNDVARQFHRAVFKHQEMLQMGLKPEPDEFIEAYLKQLNKVNDELFEGRIKAGIKGFDKNRRIKNYIPHVWKKVKVAEIIKRHGTHAVRDLLIESIESAKRQGKIASDEATDILADKQLNWINGLGDAMEYTEEIGAGISGRGKSRIPLDFTVEKNGISMLDLVDTDIPSVMDSYIQRAGADIGVSEATRGLIRSEGDFEKFLTPDSDEAKQLVMDARDMLYGRPTRTGMSPEMRSLMDLVTVQQMGGIGVAQLAETGTMAQRLIVNYMSQPKVAKKIWQMAGESIDDKGVMAQVRSISAVNDNMEYINRYSVNNIDQAQIDELSDLRAASIDAVDKVTLGAYKAQFGRLLGSLSGVNAVQKAQSRLLQASFSVDVARQARFGKGTSTTARLNDLGLTGDSKAFMEIRKHVEFDDDGFPSNFNFDKWDKAGLDEFVHAMNREEAQLMPRVMAGELPVFMNKPLWQVIMQFRKTPLAFMSKGAQRNLQFADREAVLGTVLNSLTAGITRYSKFALAGGGYAVLSDKEFQQPTLNQMQPWNYVSNFGILGDAYTLGQSWSKTYQNKDGIEALWEGAQQVSTVSAIDAAYHAVQGDPSNIKKSMPLNTLPLVTEVSNAVVRHMEQDNGTNN